MLWWTFSVDGRLRTRVIRSILNPGNKHTDRHIAATREQGPVGGEGDDEDVSGIFVEDHWVVDEDVNEVSQENESIDQRKQDNSHTSSRTQARGVL
jgi:hypothetical protein